MTTDLEIRLRQYGDTLDRATRDAHSTGPQPGFRVDDWERDAASGGLLVDRARNRRRGLAAATGLAAAASVAFVLVAVQPHSPSYLPPDTAAGATPDSAPVTAQDVQPVISATTPQSISEARDGVVLIDASGLPGAMQDAISRLSDDGIINVSQFTVSDRMTVASSNIFLVGGEQPAAALTRESLALSVSQLNPRPLDETDTLDEYGTVIPDGTAAVVVIGQDWFTRE